MSTKLCALLRSDCRDAYHDKDSKGFLLMQATNKNVSWLGSPASWFMIVALILLMWLILSLFLPSGEAWTYVHLVHGVVSYILLHYNKGSPVEMDQGKYDSLTFWEQLDDGVQYTSTRKFFTAIPVVLFVLAINGSDFKKQPLGLNLIVLLVLLIAKLPSMHKIRIFGINKYWWCKFPCYARLPMAVCFAVGCALYSICCLNA